MGDNPSSAFGDKSVGKPAIVDSYGSLSWKVIRESCTETPWILNLVASVPTYETVTLESPRRCVIIPVPNNEGIWYDQSRTLICVVVCDGEVFVRAVFKVGILEELENNRQMGESPVYRNVMMVKSCYVLLCSKVNELNFEYQLMLEDVTLHKPDRQLMLLPEISTCWENSSVTSRLKMSFLSGKVEFAWEKIHQNGGLDFEPTTRLLKLKPRLKQMLSRMPRTQSENSTFYFWLRDDRGKKCLWIVDNCSDPPEQNTNGGCADVTTTCFEVVPHGHRYNKKTTTVDVTAVDRNDNVAAPDQSVNSSVTVINDNRNPALRTLGDNFEAANWDVRAELDAQDDDSFNMAFNKFHMEMENLEKFLNSAEGVSLSAAANAVNVWECIDWDNLEKSLPRLKDDIVARLRRGLDNE